MRRLRLLLLLALTLTLRPPAHLPVASSPPARPSAAPPPVQSPPTRRALLVGVTDYPALRKSDWLEGGANDARLLAELLADLGFPAQGITVLSEVAGKADPRLLPTRANIERECKRLAGHARAGDQVVVALSGHGSRQRAPAGRLDSTFLPRDAGPDHGPDGTRPNAITGRELGDWLRPVALNKAFLWVVVDACHSGEMLRGVKEKARQVLPRQGLGGPAAWGEEGHFVPRLAQLPGVALLYACEPHETTAEVRFPPGVEGARTHGLLTWTLTRVLRSASDRLTYRELTQRVLRDYAAQARQSPTPVIVGAGRDLAVLGQEKALRPRIVVTRKGGRLVVSAGELHGLTVGSVLAVHPPFGVKGGLRGHVRVTRAHPAFSEVVPCAHGEVPAPHEQDLPGGRCEVALVDFGDMRVPVAVDRAGSGQGAVDLERLGEALRALAHEEGAPIRYEDDPGKALWLVRLRGGKALLVRAAEWEDRRADRPPAPPGLGPFAVDASLPGRLKVAFTRVLRAENLVRLAGGPFGPVEGRRPDGEPDVKLEIVRPSGGAGAQEGGGIAVFHDGDRVVFRITNTGKVRIDVTLLYVDSTLGIGALFPDFEGNRLAPGQTQEVEARLEATPGGREYAVVLAVKSERGTDPVDFVALAQPSADAARSHARGRTLESALGQFLAYALYQDGTRSGVARGERSSFATALVPLQLGPAPEGTGWRGAPAGIESRGSTGRANEGHRP